MEATGLLLLKLSEALRRENMVRASGKLGGVAGVLAGVHICGKETGGQGRRAARPGASSLSAAARGAPAPPAEPRLREGHGGTCGTSPHGPGPLLSGGTGQPPDDAPHPFPSVHSHAAAAGEGCAAAPLLCQLLGASCRQRLFRALKINPVVRAPVRGPGQDPAAPPGATRGLQLSGSAGTRLSPCLPGARAHCGHAGRLLCTLQIPNCPGESNEATAASKSLRHICPGRLRAAEAQELMEQSLGSAGRAEAGSSLVSARPCARTPHVRSSSWRGGRALTI